MEKIFWGALLVFASLGWGCAGAVVVEPGQGPEPEPPVLTAEPRPAPAPSASAEPCCGLGTCAKQVVAACADCVGEASCCWDVTGVRCGDKQ